jgi:hypothetical protein
MVRHLLPVQILHNDNNVDKNRRTNQRRKRTVGRRDTKRTSLRFNWQALTVPQSSSGVVVNNCTEETAIQYAVLSRPACENHILTPEEKQQPKPPISQWHWNKITTPLVKQAKQLSQGKIGNAFLRQSFADAQHIYIAYQYRWFPTQRGGTRRRVIRYLGFATLQLKPALQESDVITAPEVDAVVNHYCNTSLGNNTCSGANTGANTDDNTDASDNASNNAKSDAARNNTNSDASHNASRNAIHNANTIANTNASNEGNTFHTIITTTTPTPIPNLVRTLYIDLLVAKPILPPVDAVQSSSSPLGETTLSKPPSIGMTLMQKVEQFALQQQCRKLQLSGIPYVINYWRKLGFVFGDSGDPTLEPVEIRDRCNALQQLRFDTTEEAQQHSEFSQLLQLLIQHGFAHKRESTTVEDCDEGYIMNKQVVLTQ